MDIPRGSSIALPLPSILVHPERHRRLSRHSSHTSSEFGPPTANMAIPGARMDDVPPPLPPPRYNHDLDQGLDIAWSWQNEDLPGDSSRLAPIKPGSSLLGHQSMSQHAGDENEDIDMDLDADEDALSSIPSTRRSSQSQYATGSNMATLAFRSPSSSGIYHRSVVYFF